MHVFINVRLINLNIDIFYNEVELSFLDVEMAISTFDKMGVFYQDGIVRVENYNTKYFIIHLDDKVVVSESIHYILEKYSCVNNQECQSFYRRFGFILPPYTFYDRILTLTPYIGISLKSRHESFKFYFPEKNDNFKQLGFEGIIEEYFDRNKGDKEILVSGGIDSSALLGFLGRKNEIVKAHMINMKSMPYESGKAQSMCDSLSLPLELHTISGDLTNLAEVFLKDVKEPISDQVALPLMKLFSIVTNPNKKIKLVDGQGADSLLCGLPINKIFDIWVKTRKFRRALNFLSFFPITKDKSTPFKRNIYRVTKSLKCISESDFSKVFIIVLVEDNAVLPGELDDEFRRRIVSIYERLGCWHSTIKYIYMFNILPVREMQKYSFSEDFNIEIQAPFLDRQVINSLFYTSSDNMIVRGKYKYPISILAESYWPEHFKSSATSPFQVEYFVKGDSLKELSINNL